MHAGSSDSPGAVSALSALSQSINDCADRETLARRRADLFQFSMDSRLHCRTRMYEASRARGFTLIEVTIAIGLLVTIALGSAQMFALAIRHNLSARQQLVMSVIAARKIDELAAAAATGVVHLSPPDALERPVEGFSDATEEAAGRYVRRWLVAPLPAPGGEALLAIVVRVTAPGTSDVQLTTICQAGTP
jgi:prepilin-type N-terminal cleavage/methylation domain-containing protein